MLCALPEGDESNIGGVPDVDPSAFVAPGSVLVGSVTLAEGSSVWFGCVLRADSGDSTTAVRGA